MFQKFIQRLKQNFVNAKMKAMFSRYKNSNCQALFNLVLLQHIGSSLRKGGPIELKLERFEEALYDTTSGLTYAAFSGIIICKILLG